MFTLWFMGRPASGKSTIASRVEDRLVDMGYPVENLDGDDIRRSLHPDLGFSRADRRTNNRRTAYIAKLLNRNGIPVIVGMITPFRESQEQARDIIETEGEFVLVYVKCSLEEAERRDPKGLYAAARAGNIDQFTGVNHPFQSPLNPEVTVDTENTTVDQCVEKVVNTLFKQELNNDVGGKYGFPLDKTREAEIVRFLRETDHLA